VAAVKPEIPPDEPVPEAPASASDADGWALLDGMRRKLDDQATLARKTQTQVGQLAESIAALVEQQRKRSRALNLNSFVAYAIFTILLGGAFYVLFNSRASELVGERDRATNERDLATKRADVATADVAARDAADAKAWDVYQLLETGKRTEAKDALAALDAAPLSKTERALLAARAHESQVVAIDTAFKTALAAFKAGRYVDVIAPLETALASEPTGARAIQIKYYLGVAYAKGNELDKAIAHLTAAVAGDVDIDDARFQLASALDRAGQYPRARAEYDRFATAKPQSPHAMFAMRRSATLARMPAAPGAAGSAGAGSAAPKAMPVPPPLLPGPGSGSGSAAPKAPAVVPKPLAGSGSSGSAAPTGNPVDDAIP